ncbi:MAG: HPP family protein [Gallionella sp.]|nr:HPP family protein [Gallionella sp.]
MSLYKKIISASGVGSDATGHAEKLISAAGGFIGISLTLWLSSHYLGLQGAALLVASMGASAVLLFAVPHGALSQPWPLVGGNLISAIIGVSCAQAVSNMLIAAPLAVALAIAAMYYLRCIHPPGGATALTAVVGGAQVHQLGYQFVLTPVLLNVVVMLIAAVAVNWAFPWRRYPAAFRKLPESVARPQLAHADFQYALAQTGSYVDVNEDDLLNIYRLAAKHAWQLSDQPEKITAGLCYSNGETGDDLSVRKVVSLGEPGAEVTYKIVAGEGLGMIKTSPLADFSDWQRYEVILKNNAWHRIRNTGVGS